MSLILIILLIVILIGALPVFPYSRGWGGGPVSSIGVILLILILLLLFGYL